MSSLKKWCLSWDQKDEWKLCSWEEQKEHPRLREELWGRRGRRIQGAGKSLCLYGGSEGKQGRTGAWKPSQGPHLRSLPYQKNDEKSLKGFFGPGTSRQGLGLQMGTMKPVGTSQFPSQALWSIMVHVRTTWTKDTSRVPHLCFSCILGYQLWPAAYQRGQSFKRERPWTIGFPVFICTPPPNVRQQFCPLRSPQYPA